jgi:hypothetical protein
MERYRLAFGLSHTGSGPSSMGLHDRHRSFREPMERPGAKVFQLGTRPPGDGSGQFVTRLGLADHALRIPSAGITPTVTAQSDQRKSIRHGTGHSIVPARFMVAHTTSSEHQRATFTTTLQVDYDRPCGLTILVPQMAVGDMADIRASTIC